MLVTRELLQKGKSRNGGWNLKQVKILGFDQWRKGWKRTCIGKQISTEDYFKFIRLKNTHLKDSIPISLNF